MINITEKEKCCGCGACAQICPKACISMQFDREGFKYPKVDLASCVDCHLCEDVCQYLSDNQNSNPPIEAYYYVNNNEVVRKTSSSGGFFSAISEYVIANKGIVFGAKFVDNWDVNIVSVSDLESLFSLRGSKYVQADTCNTYREVKSLLKNKVLVLYSGTPCQIFGLKKFLKRDYDNLICIDFSCHSVPSPLIWKKYIEEVSCGKKINYISFRNKESNGWNNYSLQVSVQKSSSKYSVDIVNEGNNENLYMKAFLRQLICRPSCSNCAARKFLNLADITISDFWNVERYHNESFLNDNKGVSLILVRSQKGEFLCNKILSTGKFDRVDFTEVEMESSHFCLVGSYKNHPMRNVFFFLYQHISISLSSKIKFCLNSYDTLRTIYYNIIKR